MKKELASAQLKRLNDDTEIAQARLNYRLLAALKLTDYKPPPRPSKNPKGRPKFYDRKLIKMLWEEWQTGLWKRKKNELIREKFEGRIRNLKELDDMLEAARKAFKGKQVIPASKIKQKSPKVKVSDNTNPE